MNKIYFFYVLMKNYLRTKMECILSTSESRDKFCYFKEQSKQAKEYKIEEVLDIGKRTKRIHLLEDQGNLYDGEVTEV